MQGSDRRRAGDYDQRDGRERTPLACLEAGSRLRVDADVGREWKMDERDDAEPRRFVLDLGWHGPEREAVDEHDRAIGNGRENARGSSEVRGSGIGKVAFELADVNGPPAAAQAVRNAAVINGAAGLRFERPGDN